MKSIPIGQFSKLTRLSVKALRLYDEKGLLVPDVVDTDSRYRYYTRDQLRRAEVIRVLRSLEMPLRVIASVLEMDDSSQVVTELEAHKAQVVEQLAAKQRAVAYLDALIKEQALEIECEITVEEVAPERVASVTVETKLSTVAPDIQAGFGRLVGGLGQAGVTPAGTPLIVFHDVIDVDQAGEIELAVPISTSLPEDSTLTERHLEGGPVAKAIHQGPYEAIAPIYQGLSTWIAEQGYTLTGPPREKYLNDPQTVPSNELLTAVEYPVCRPEQSV